MQRTSRHLLPVMGVALVFGLLSAPDAHAQSAKKIVTVGDGDSPVRTHIAKTRTRWHSRELLRVARERKEKLQTAAEERRETKKRLRAHLADVDVVAVDASAPGTSEDDGLVVEAALEEGVPVVLERANSKKMARLTKAFGVDAETAVIESRGEGRELQITLVGGPEATIKTGPKKTIQPPAQRTPENKKVKEALKQYEAKQKAANANVPKPAPAPHVAKLTHAQKVARVEKLVSEKAFKKGARRHGLITGKCTGLDCKEASLVISPVEFCPGGLCSAYSTLAPVLEWGVYKTVSQEPTTGKSRDSAYIMVRAAGRPNLAMMWDQKDNRGFYLEGWNVQLAATYPENMSWTMAKAVPENANKQVSVAYSTGFTVGGSAAGGSSGSLGLNVSYSSSEQRTMNTEEFGITRTTTPNSVSWTHMMQLDGLGESYTKPEDLFIYWFGSSTDVAMVPTIAKLGTDFRGEAVWSGYRDDSCGSCPVTVTGTFSLQMKHASVEEISTELGLGYLYNTYTESFEVSTPPATLTFYTNW